MADHTGKSTSLWCTNVSLSQRNSKVSSDESKGDDSQDRMPRHSPPPPASQNNGSSESREPPSHEPRDVILSSKISQQNESFARELIALTELHDSSQPFEVQLLNVILHESYEATSMELRVSPHSTGAIGDRISEIGGTNGSGGAKGVLYIGMATGVIQKHTISLDLS
jgi:hypothetical protein